MFHRFTQLQALLRVKKKEHTAVQAWLHLSPWPLGNQATLLVLLHPIFTPSKQHNSGLIWQSINFSYISLG
jgi:hypothetical protein